MVMASGNNYSCWRVMCWCMTWWSLVKLRKSEVLAVMVFLKLTRWNASFEHSFVSQTTENYLIFLWNYIFFVQAQNLGYIITTILVISCAPTGCLMLFSSLNRLSNLNWSHSLQFSLCSRILCSPWVHPLCQLQLLPNLFCQQMLEA